MLARRKEDFSGDKIKISFSAFKTELRAYTKCCRHLGSSARSLAKRRKCTWGAHDPGLCCEAVISQSSTSSVSSGTATSLSPSDGNYLMSPAVQAQATHPRDTTAMSRPFSHPAFLCATTSADTDAHLHYHPFAHESHQAPKMQNINLKLVIFSIFSKKTYRTDTPCFS